MDKVVLEIRAGRSIYFINKLFLSEPRPYFIKYDQ